MGDLDTNPHGLCTGSATFNGCRPAWAALSQGREEGQISYLRRGAEVTVVAGGPRKEGLS